MKRAIVFGATGAIGTALIEELVKHGIEVLVLCRKDSKRTQNIVRSPLVKLKYCTLDGLTDIVNDYDKKYDVFYHFAWAGTVGHDRNDMYIQSNNIRYALDAVATAKKFGCDTFVGAGSQAEYGRFNGILKSDTPTFPEMGYGYAKLCAGMMTRDYAHQLGLRHIWTRVLSVYGPHDGSQSMVMSTITKLLNKEIPQFTKGEQMWDYLYSKDAAKAFYLLGDSKIDGKTYVLGSGQAKPLKEYIEEIKNSIAPNLQIKYGDIPYSEKQVMHLEADIGEIRRDTGWYPMIDFKTGIKKTIESIVFDAETCKFPK